MDQNIFLDFLNRDSRQIYGLFDNAVQSTHLSLILEALNVSVFLCADFCLMPLGFSLECNIVKEALSLRLEFCKERLIRRSIREASIDDYLEKKAKEYSSFQDLYSEIFNASNEEFLKKCPQSLIQRNSAVGIEIVRSWEQGPDVGTIWQQLIRELKSTQIEEIRRIPRKISERGDAVVWPAIQRDITNYLKINKCEQFRYALQYHYFRIYLQEYKLRTITSLPFSRHHFWLNENDLLYDYEALKAALSPMNLWDLIILSSATSLIQLRIKAGYFKFRTAFHAVTTKCNSAREVKKVFVLAVDSCKSAFKKTSIIERNFPKYVCPPDSGFELTSDELEAVDFRFKTIGSLVLKSLDNFWEELAIPQVEFPTTLYRKEKRMEISCTVAIFVALQMEREILVKRWKLSGTYGKPWTGTLGSVRVLLFTANEMGRVPAAISTMRFLAEVKPDFLIVTGITGGFEAAGVKLGDVIVASSIADLAIRKIREGEQGIRQEFRPKEFRTDQRILTYLNTGSFNEGRWVESVVDDEEWPKGLRPKIEFGTLACTDEVVSSDAWIKNLYEAWPKLLGVEMESGGVCAAAEDVQLPVIVIRGVSDHANPIKSDTEWRRRAMKTTAHLLENINYSEIFEKVCMK